jgi:hypothetical protein
MDGGAVQDLEPADLLLVSCTDRTKQSQSLESAVHIHEAFLRDFGPIETAPPAIDRL